MEEDFEDDCGETDYIKSGWDNNVDNCNIDESRTVMIGDDTADYEYVALEAGIIIGEMGIRSNTITMSSCGTWLWIVFDSPEMAMAFKLRWK